MPSAELRLKNAFLVTLAQDLAPSLAMFSERTAQVRAFAIEMSRQPTTANVRALTTEHASDTSRPEADVSPLTSPARLSRREAEVLGLLAQGLSNKKIAGILWLSERTVERRITSLYRRIGVERRGETIALALHHSPIKADKE